MSKILKDAFYFKKTYKEWKGTVIALLIKEDLLDPIRRGWGETGNGVESLCTELGDVSGSKLNVTGHLTKKNNWTVK